MAENTLVVVARPEWVPGGSPWWSTCKVTLLNLTDAAVVNPYISFKVGPKQVLLNNHGLDWTRKGDTVSGYLVPERQVIPPRSSREFRLSVQGTGQSQGPLPSRFTVNGRPADPPEDHEPPSMPRRVRASLVGSRLITLDWDASRDNVAVAGYRVSFSAGESAEVHTLTTARPSVTIAGLASATEYRISVVAFDVSDNPSKVSDVVKVRTGPPLPDMGDWDVSKAPFLDFTAWPTPKVSRFARETRLDGFILGFLSARRGGDKTLCWGGNDLVVDAEDGRSFSGNATVSDYGKKDLQEFRKQGGKVVLSLGGTASGVPIEAEETDVARLVACYAAVLRNYEVRHLDFSFGSSFLHDEEGLERHVSAMSQLLAVYPTLKLSYSLPVDGAPGSLVGFNDEGVRLLRRLASAGIEPSLINGMLMEFGLAAPRDAFDCCVHALEGMHAHIAAAFPHWGTEKVWRRMGACPMFGRHINGREFTLEHQRKLADFARKHQLGCLSGWEVTMDGRQGRLDFCKCIAAHGPGTPEEELAAG
ncbi:fibronectin type III domain-containing protein [Myxococcus stipitatus]|uniref:fibronectin type III domain-containing protein n=1 Tax=Myxococcus stipitatus TaxID=83455 RepID=UPI0031453904